MKFVTFSFNFKFIFFNASYCLISNQHNFVLQGVDKLPSSFMPSCITCSCSNSSYGNHYYIYIKVFYKTRSINAGVESFGACSLYITFVVQFQNTHVKFCTLFIKFIRTSSKPFKKDSFDLGYLHWDNHTVNISTNLSEIFSYDIIIFSIYRHF